MTSERTLGMAYAGLALGAAASTANAWRPVIRVGYPVIGTYLSGIPHTELPLMTGAATVALGAAAAMTGATRTTAGRAGLAMSAASLLGLARLQREHLRDVDVLEAALVGAFGLDYRNRVVRPPVPGPPAAEWPVSPLPRRGHDSPYRAAVDVPYGPHGRRNQLDIWRHPDLPTDARAPVVLHIHGGAWVTGDKTWQGVPLMHHMAGRGWVCVTAAYRLAPRATWPEPLVDVKRAVAWVRQHIAAHGGDPSFIAVTGGSAGGHLSALLATTANRHPEVTQPGFEDADTGVQAAIPFYGAYDITDLEGTGRRDAISFWERYVLKEPYVDDEAPLWRLGSPVLGVHADVPPLLVVHGREDALVRVEGARLFVDLLRRSGAATVAYAELPHARHMFDVFFTPRTRSTVEAVERFLGVVYADHLASRGHG